MTITLLFLFLLQTTAGEIIVTLQDADENPVIGETIEFFAESEPLALGSCMTNESGTCTITVDAPIDASGFIRGTLIFSYGRRPVIWPGSTLELTLILDETGEFNTNSDVYVTRTPKVEKEEKEKEEEKEEVTNPTQEEVTSPTQEEVTSPTQAQEEVTSPTQAQEEVDTEKPLEPEEHETPIKALIFRGFFIFLLVCTLIFYIWKTKQ